VIENEDEHMERSVRTVQRCVEEWSMQKRDLENGWTISGRERI
jgi:hypothetical protein